MQKIIPVILNGGSGTRLWPLSREDKPKQFLSLLGDDTLFQSTIKRALRISGTEPKNVVTVTLEKHKKETLRQALEIDPSLSDHILCEPDARNTAAAFIYAAYYVRQYFGEDALMWVLPSDHHIDDEVALRSALEHAANIARYDYLVTFGIQPTRPETGYGYISNGEALNEPDVYAVEQFVEKPTIEIAEQYFESGEYLWNSGMHVFNAKAAIEAFNMHAPKTDFLVRQSLSDPNTMKKPKAKVYTDIQKEPFEKAVLEKSKNVAVVSCDIGWCDIGSWRSLWMLRSKNRDIRFAHHGFSKQFINALEHLEDKNVISSQECTWGTVDIISEHEYCSLREVTVWSGQKRCVKMHNQRDELWIVKHGEGLFTLNGQDHVLQEGESIYIPAGSVHFIANSGSSELKLFEFQYGENLDESDIVRLDDPDNAKVAA